MSLLSRLENLERAAMTSPDRPRLILMGWQGEPYRAHAQRDGKVMERESSESAEAFRARVAKHFTPAKGCALVWMDAR